MELVQRSLTAGILILCIAAIRIFCINHLPKKTFLILWSVVLIRLLLPVSTSVPNPFLSEHDVQMDMVVKKTKINTEGKRIIQEQIQQSQSKESPFLFLQNKNNFLEEDVWRWIYAAGVITMILCWMFFYRRSYRKLTQALPLQNKRLEEVWESCRTTKRKVRLFISDQITTPMTYGLAHPKIVLPKGIDCSQNIEYILKHESIHIKRMDIAWKMLMMMALSFHWWNPLVWIMMILFNRDLEIACDESVLSSWGAQERAEYAMALIQLAEQKNFFSPFGSGFGKNAVQERIVAIMKYKKITMPGILAGVLLTASSLTVFADFDAKTEQKPEKTIETETDSDRMTETEMEELNEMNVRDGEFIVDGGFLEGILRSVDGEWYFSDDDGKTWIKLKFTDGVSIESDLELDLSPSITEESGEIAVEPLDIEYVNEIEGGETAVELYGSESIKEMTESGNYYKIWTDKKETDVDLTSTEEGDSQEERKAFEEIAQWMEDYKEYGIQFNAETGELYYQDKLVYYFADMKKERDGTVSGNVYSNEEIESRCGVIAVHDENGETVGVKLLDEEQTKAYRDSIW